MKILEINDNEGYFLTKELQYKKIGEIGKNDIYFLLNHVFENDEVELDICTDDNIKNPANKIIYEKLSEKINLFISDKDRIAREIDKTFEKFKYTYSDELQTD